MIKVSSENKLIKWTLVFNRTPVSEIIAEFEFFKENDKIWLNNCFVLEDFQKKGIGTFIIETAIAQFGEIYFSNAEKGEHKRRNIENDSRYLEPPDGYNFVKNLIRKGIIKPEWWTDPFK